MLPGQLRGNGDGVEWIDDDPLQAAFCEVRHAFLLPFGSTVRFNYLLARYFQATREKVKPDFRPALCCNDSRLNSAQAQELSRDPHEKGRKLLTEDDVSLPQAPAILTLERMARNVREDLVKVPEVGKRSACYHSLRKVHAPRRARIKKRGSRTIYAETAASPDPYTHRHARTTFWHPRSSGRHAAGAYRGDPAAHGRLRRGRQSTPGVRAQDGE